MLETTLPPSEFVLISISALSRWKGLRFELPRIQLLSEFQVGQTDIAYPMILKPQKESRGSRGIKVIKKPEQIVTLQSEFVGDA
jgi:hypothetical protein